MFQNHLPPLPETLHLLSPRLNHMIIFTVLLGPPLDTIAANLSQWVLEVAAVSNIKI